MGEVRSFFGSWKGLSVPEPPKKSPSQGEGGVELVNKMGDKKIYGLSYREFLVGNLVFGFMIIGVWSVLLKFLPDSWWTTVISIIGFLSSSVIIGLGSWLALKAFMPSIIALFLAVSIWFILVVLIRSFILELLGVI